VAARLASALCCFSSVHVPPFSFTHIAPVCGAGLKPPFVSHVLFGDFRAIRKLALAGACLLGCATAETRMVVTDLADRTGWQATRMCVQVMAVTCAGCCSAVQIADGDVPVVRQMCVQSSALFLHPLRAASVPLVFCSRPRCLTRGSPRLVSLGRDCPLPSCPCAGQLRRRLHCSEAALPTRAYVACR